MLNIVDYVTLKRNYLVTSDIKQLLVAADVTHRMLDVAVAEIILNQSSIRALFN